MELEIRKIETPYIPLQITVRKDSPSDDAVIKEMFVENVYHTQDYYFEANDVILDVGANIGVFTLDVLLRAKNKGVPVKIYAFEPEPHNLELLTKNLSDNEWVFDESVVWIVTEALSDKDGESFIDDNHGGSRLSANGTAIKTMTLDHFFEQEKLDSVAFAKFDIEGSEVPVLMAASDETLDKIHHMAIEFDEQNGVSDFTKLIGRFARNCGISTLGVPARGCYIYTERFEKW